MKEVFSFLFSVICTVLVILATIVQIKTDDLSLLVLLLWLALAFSNISRILDYYND